MYQVDYEERPNIDPDMLRFTRHEGHALNILADPEAEPSDTAWANDVLAIVKEARENPLLRDRLWEELAIKYPLYGPL